MRCKSADGLILVLILQVLNRPGDSQGASNPTQDINLTELAQKSETYIIMFALNLCYTYN